MKTMRKMGLRAAVLGAATTMLAVSATSTVIAAGTRQFGPFASTSPDGSSCGFAWAQDTFNRSFTVHDNGNGTFSVHEDARDGVFTTSGATSPGACETTPHHGSSVRAGVTGRFQGFVDYTVTSSAFNPNGCPTASACNTRGGFLASVFPGGSLASCQGFNYEYSSNDSGLTYRHWQDKSDNQCNDKFEGDIADQ